MLGHILSQQMGKLHLDHRSSCLQHSLVLPCILCCTYLQHAPLACMHVWHRSEAEGSAVDALNNKITWKNCNQTQRRVDMGRYDSKAGASPWQTPPVCYDCHNLRSSTKTYGKITTQQQAKDSSLGPTSCPALSNGCRTHMTTTSMNHTPSCCTKHHTCTGPCQCMPQSRHYNMSRGGNMVLRAS